MDLEALTHPLHSSPRGAQSCKKGWDMSNKGKIVLVDEVYLKDFDGSDAMLKDQDSMKAKVQSVATAALPTLLAKAIEIVKSGKNNRDAIEAMKFIRSLSDGETKGKTVESIAKKLSNDDILETLDGQFEDIE